VVYNIFGRIVPLPAPTPTLPHPGDGGERTFKISALPPGIYLAVVRDEKNMLGYAKFIISR